MTRAFLTKSAICCCLVLLAAPLPAVGESAPFRRPVDFVPNDGQWAPEVLFTARASGVDARFEEGGFCLASSTGRAEAVVRFRFEGARTDAAPIAAEKRVGRYSYFLGDDASRWRSGLASFARLRYEELYPGVDLVFRESDLPGDAERSGRLEYDLVLSRGAQPEEITIRCDGAVALRLDDSGALLIETSAGDLRQAPPTSWDVGPSGEKRPVECRYRLLGEHRFGFVVEGHDPELELVIDPVVTWSSFLGGSGYDQAWAVSHHDGVVVISGSTGSSDFRDEPGDCDRGDLEPIQGLDAYVARFDAETGELLSTTVVGGEAEDDLVALDVDEAGRIFVSGWTRSTDLPVTNDSTHSGDFDAYIARFSPDACELEFATFLGGSGLENANALAAGRDGIVYISGITSSFGEFPTTDDAFQPEFGGGLYDAFVCRVDTDASDDEFLTHSTLLGGSSNEANANADAIKERIRDGGIAVLEGDRVVVVGRTNSTDFPMPLGAPAGAKAGGTDMFVAILELSPEAELDPEERLIASTYVGGSNYESALAVAVDNDTRIWVAGYTWSGNLEPFPGPEASFGGNDILLFSFDEALLNPETLVRLGGASYEVAEALSVSDDGVVTIAGFSRSTNIQTTADAFDRHLPALDPPAQDAYLAQIDADTGDLLYATYVGGDAAEVFDGVTTLPDGSVVAVGRAGAGTIPGLPNQDRAGGDDAIVVLFGPPPPGCQEAPIRVERQLWDDRAIREVDVSTPVFVSGETYEVRLGLSEVRPAGECVAPGPLVITEQLPAGWDFVDVTGGGDWDPASRSISWEFDDAAALAGSELRYLAIAGDADGAVFEGSIQEPGSFYTFEVSGEASAARVTGGIGNFGSIQRWLILGAFEREFSLTPHAPGEAEIRRDYLADGNGVTEANIRPRAGETHLPDYGAAAASTGLAENELGRNPGGEPVWIDWHDADDLIDFESVYGRIENDMCYAVTYLEVEDDTEVDFGVTSEDSIQILLNGEEIHLHNIGRNNRERRYADTPATHPSLGGVELKAGTHVVLVKVFDGVLNHSFRLGFVEEDGEGGWRPVPGGPAGVSVSVEPEEPDRFRRCDANSDGSDNLADAVAMLNYLFAGIGEPQCLRALDCDGNRTVNITDPIRLLEHLFSGADRPPSPFGECGIDTADGENPLSCEVTCPIAP